jgi:tetratricopeptide (TPR) repeat protein
VPRKRHTEVSHYDDSHAVGRRLREARERAGLSQRQLSFPGCSPAYLSRIEAGDRTPSLQLMRELAHRLGVTEEFLAYGQEADTARTEPLLEAEVALRMDDQDLAEELYRAELESEEADRRAAALEGLGRLALRRGRLTEAIEQLEAARELYGERALDRIALNATLGRAHAFAGDLEAAIALFQRSLEEARKKEDVLAEVRFAVLLSAALTDVGRLAQAEEAVASILARADELSDPLARIRVYWAQCRLHSLAERPELAERYGRKVIELLELTEDSYNLAGAYRLMAGIKLAQDEPTDALELVGKAQAVLADAGNEVEAATNRLVEARALAALGQLDDAASIAMGLRDALAERPEETGESYSLLAKTFAAAGESARAIELYELACGFLEQSPSRHLVSAYAELAELLDAQGRKDEALEVLRKAVRVRTDVASRT